MPYTNIDATIDETQKALVLSTIATVEEPPDFLINLTPPSHLIAPPSRLRISETPTLRALR